MGFIKKNFVLLLAGMILLLGGLGVETLFVQLFGVLAGLLILNLTALQGKRIKLPRSIFLYALFLLVFIINSFVISVDTKKSLEVFSLFLGGGLFWIAFYNLKSQLSPRFAKLTVFLGVVFAGLYIYNSYLSTDIIRRLSLYTQSNAIRNHNHLGDLWALGLIVSAYYLSKKPKNLLYWAIWPLGLYLIVQSQSRAAIVALVSGILFLGFKSGAIEKYKKIFYGILLIAVGLFLYLGIQKPVLFSRPYFVQALFGFIRNPQGVGMGNFGVISSNPENQILGLSGFSYVAHNIVLEILTGVGIMGFIFVFWLYRVLVGLWKQKGKEGIVYSALFIALTANFFFDSTYFIPTLLWLWFAFLGLARIL